MTDAERDERPLKCGKQEVDWEVTHGKDEVRDSHVGKEDWGGGGNDVKTDVTRGIHVAATSHAVP